MSVNEQEGSVLQDYLILLGLGGVIGGIGGGIGFAVLLIVFGFDAGFFQAVAALISVSDPTIGIILHMLISVFFGLIFGSILILVPRFGESQMATIFAGILWALFLWIVGDHILFSLFLNIPLDTLITLIFNPDFYLSEGSLTSLGSHLIYGFTLALATWNLPKLLE